MTILLRQKEKMDEDLNRFGDEEKSIVEEASAWGSPFSQWCWRTGGSS